MATPDDDFDALVRTLSGCPSSMIVEALAAAVDPKDLEHLAAELDEFLLNEVGAGTAQGPVDAAMKIIESMNHDTRQQFDKAYQKAKDHNFGEIAF
jgi:hypothetical protein